MRNNLLEGLRINDLKDLVLPLLSIDEFESKIDDDAVVMAFFVRDHDPAADLNQFIQKSSVTLYDTEVSPAPNKEGYFVVFVEFARDEKIWSKIQTILNEIQNLVDLKIDDWSFTCYGHNGAFELTQDNVYVMVRDKPLPELIAQAQEELVDRVYEAFQRSVLDRFHFDSNRIKWNRNNVTEKAVFVAEGDMLEILEDLDLQGEPVRLDEQVTAREKTMRYLLGENWGFTSIGPYFIMTELLENQSICVRFN